MNNVIRQGCPPWETLEALHEGRLAGTEAANARQHMEACAPCRTDFAMLQEFVSAAPAAVEQADVERIADKVRKARAPKKQGWWLGWSVPKWAAALATLVLMVAIGSQWLRQKDTDLSGFQGSETLRAGAVIDISPRGDFFIVPTHFVWNPIPNAVSYQIIASEVDGAELWRGLTNQASLTPPPPLLDSLLPSKTVVLHVTALDRSGAPLARSEATRIRYVRR